ncbi:MAG TPA: DUF885 domain-containing protein [Polyangiaceae bacterium]|nr:DUF885 domain-containing protein [Polyangiaceae bacterium]
MTTSPSPSEPLAALADEYWELRLEADPIEATFLGERRCDHRLPDVTEAGRERVIKALSALLDRARAIDAGALSRSDWVTHRALLDELQNDLAVRTENLGAWTVDPRGGPHVRLMNVAEIQRPSTAEQAEALVARWQVMGAYIDAHTENLRRALAEGKLPTFAATARVIEQLDELLQKPDAEWMLAAPARSDHPSLPEGSREALQKGVLSAIAGSIRPAFKRHRDALAAEALPRGRDDARVGLSDVPGGEASYRRMIEVHTSLPLTAEVIHVIGIEQNAAIRAEMIDIGERLFGARDFAAIQARLRTDPALFFTSRDEVEAKAQAALDHANREFPKWFGRAPRTPCVVKRIEPYEEVDNTIAYYLPPAADGSRPGTYYVNTYAPETRPRYEAEVLAFHEAVPGHHSQIALAQELEGIPAFRKHAGVTAYVEGWALYTERLAEEMGLYSSDLDRLGMLSFSAWRASRLVVDTGLHAMGWSRGRAVEYMMANTILAENNVLVEVDRYINWPGQALAYKLGELEVFRLRGEAERRLGARFRVQRFHDAVLENGAVSLPVLRDLIERFIEDESAP